MSLINEYRGSLAFLEGEHSLTIKIGVEPKGLASLSDAVFALIFLEL